jgi:soluble lytic murein transglycosylase-like protein
LLQISYPRFWLRLLLALSAISGFLIAGAAHAALYKFVDDNGVANFTNVPTDHRYKLVQGAKFPANRGRLLASLPAYPEAERERYEAEIIAAAKVTHVDPALLHAVISVESGYNRFARSNKGAVGLMQLTMDTAIRYGISNRLDPLQNIWAGAHYLHDLMDLFHNDVRLVLAAYNAGEQAVIRYGNRVPPYPETIDYVPRVLSYYKMYRREFS